MMAEKLRIAILYICTGAYTAFWEGFYRSYEEKFIPEAEKHYYVFTDADSVYGEEDNPRIHRYFQENLGWPGNTLFRVRIFHPVIDELRAYDYVFYMNANIICKSVITADEFLPRKEGLLFVAHPGEYNKRPYRHPYERNPRSRAYIPYKQLDATDYVCGGINGGKADAYCDMILELEKRIDDDYERGIIARWHDESQINRYAFEHPGYKKLSPAYGYPEGWQLPFPCKLLLVEKDKVIPMPALKRPVKIRNEGPFAVRAMRSVRGRLQTAGKAAGEICKNAYLALYYRLHGR